jgi:hypothetical protein
MSEPDAVWYAYPETCLGYGLSIPTSVEWDYTEKLFGQASVHVATGNGWDIGTMYRPSGDSIASWSVLAEDTLTFWLKSINNTGYGFQYCNVIIGNNCGGFYKYTAPAATILNPTIDQWKRIDVPLIGGNPWSISINGNVSYDDLNYVEIHADTWDVGFELWIDGLSFNSIFTGQKKNESTGGGQAIIYPNPVKSEAFVEFNLDEATPVEISILDLQGRIINTVYDGRMDQGKQTISFNTETYTNGIYICRLKTGLISEISRFVVNK